MPNFLKFPSTSLLILRLIKPYNMKHLFYVLAILALPGCQKAFLPSQEKEPSAEENKILGISAFTPLNYSLVWADDFNNTSLNPNNWVVGCKDPVSGDSMPYAIGDYLINHDYAGYITPEDSYVQNGSLMLRGQKRNYTGTNPAGNYEYTDGWVMSMHRVHLNKGYIEMRAKFPSGDKVWPALWLIAEDNVWGPEFDMFEYFGKRDVRSDLMGSHLMTGTYPITHWDTSYITSYDATYDCETWHVYGFEWTAGYAKWYIDGNLVNTLNASSVSNWPDEEMYLILNNGQRSASEDHTTTWPNYLQIDYVRIYQKLNVNGDFESGSTSPWFNYGTTAIGTTYQQTGNYCAYIGDDHSGYEYTVTGLQPNTQYTFRGSVKSVNSGQPVNIGVKEYDGTANQVKVSTSSTVYTPLTATFTTGATNTTAKILFYRFDDGPGQAYGDDFELYYSPSTVVPNGDFESGSLSPWFKYGTTAISFTNFYDGDHCAYIGADNSGYEYVVPGLKPNTSYTFRGWVKAASMGQTANICVKEYDGSGGQITRSTSSTGYTLLTVPFTTGAQNTSAKVSFYRWLNGAGAAYGDNFEIFEN